MAKGYYEELIEKTIDNYCKGKNVDGKTFTRDVVEYMMLWALTEARNRWDKSKCNDDADACARTKREWDDKRRKVKLIFLDALTDIDNEMKDWDILPF